LPDLCEIPITDGTHQTPKYTTKDKGVPFLSSKDVTSQKIEWSNIKYITPELHDELYKRVAPRLNDILLAKNGTTGVAAMVETNQVFDIYVTLALIRPNCKAVVPKFLFYVINSPFCKIQFNSHLTGIGLPNLHLTDINKTLIALPPIKEQYAIIERLDNLLDLVDKLATNKSFLLRHITQAKSKILDLAIAGKLVPQSASDEPAIDALRRINPNFKPCDNPQYRNKMMRLPRSWCCASFNSINCYKSKSVNPALNPSNKYELYSVPTFDSGLPEFLKGKEIASTKALVKSNDVLLCKINPHLNRAWVVSHYKKDLVCIASSEWIVFRNDGLNPQYMQLCFTSPYFKDLMMSNVSGVGGSLTRAQPIYVKKIIVPIPPIAEQQRIVDKVTELFALLDNIQNSLEA
jgi:type I restriction enzyme S subunit